MAQRTTYEEWGYPLGMTARHRKTRIEDVHDLAIGMPNVTVVHGNTANPVYQVGGKSFVFFRTPRPDAVDPDTGERFADVVVFWVESESDKQALVQDPGLPWFTTFHFDGNPSVLLRSSRVGELSRQELAEMVEEAWLSRATPAWPGDCRPSLCSSWPPRPTTPTGWSTARPRATATSSP